MSDQHVDRLLADRQNLPWEQPSSRLRAQTLQAIRNDGVTGRRWMSKSRALIAAAVCLAAGTGLILMRSGSPAPTGEGKSMVKLDPSSMLGSALAQLTASAEESLTAEARELLEDTSRLTRRVIAQLPFTGGG